MINLSPRVCAKQLLDKMSSLPPNVPKEHHQWIVFANFMDLFALANIAVFFSISIYLQLWLMVICTVILAISYSLSVFFHLRGVKGYRYCVTFVYLMLGLVTCCCTLLIGWSGGFQYHLIVLSLMVFHIPFISKNKMWCASFLFYTVFISIYFISHIVPPYYAVPKFWANIFFVLCIFGFMFSITFILLMMSKSHQRETIQTLHENSSLKVEIADRILREIILIKKQTFLTQLLHTVDDAILVCDDTGKIVFINTILQNDLGLPDENVLYGKDVSSQLHTELRQINLPTANLSSLTFTPILLSHANGHQIRFSARRTSVAANGETLNIFTLRRSKSSQDTAPVSSWIIGGLEMDREHTVDPIAIGHRIMVESVALWKEATGREKWDFAESSGLWKVHTDEDGWQRTATLDKYLDFRRMPRFPRWLNIMESARFVIKEAKRSGHDSERIIEIEEKVRLLEKVLKWKLKQVKEVVF